MNIIHNNSKLELLVNLFNNLFHKKNLIILVGKNGLNIVALKKNKALDNIFIPYTTENYKQDYIQFIEKYKNYHILFLLDHKECELKHEMLPVLNLLIKNNNPVDKFISENYAPQDIVAYHVYEITTDSGEVWNTSIASTKFLPIVSNILEYIIKKSLKYSGMYFLSLELGTIINRILHTTKQSALAQNLQIFITITKASDIKVVVKHKDNIMSEKSVEYPYDKSDLYIQGTIEQIIEDKLLLYKNYINTLELKVCIIMLLDKPLKKLLKRVNFVPHKVIAISPTEINLFNKLTEGRFNDLALIEIFNNFNTHLALNKPLRSITTLTLINNIIFKPIIAVIIIMLLSLGFFQYKILAIQSETTDLNKKYYSLSQEYKSIKKRYPEISNVSDLVDLYNLNKMVSRQPSRPDQYIKDLTSFHNKDLKINRISWKIVDPELVNFPESNLEISLNVSYTCKANSVVQAIDVFNEFAKYLRTVFHDYNVTYTNPSDNISEVAKKIIIKSQFVINGKVGEHINVR